MAPTRFEYLATGPGYTKWRPVAYLGLAIAFYGILSTVVSLIAAIPLGILSANKFVDLINPNEPIEVESFITQVMTLLMSDPELVPWMMLMLNLSWAVAIPAVMFALALAAKVKPGYAISVTGGMRWGWFGRIVAFFVPLWAIYVGISMVLSPAPLTGPPGTTGQIIFLVAVILLTTPLQAAGEEFAFRGLLLQTIPTWFKNRKVGLFAATLVSTLVFSVAHMSLDPWILLTIGVVAVAGCWMTWRTGGLEATIAAHVVNNVMVFGQTILTGSMGSALVSSGTKGKPEDFIAMLAVYGVAALIVEWQARRHKIQTLTEVKEPLLNPAV